MHKKQHVHAKPVPDTSERGYRLGFCRQEFQADVSWHMNLSRTQIGIAQSCLAGQKAHDTDHILHSHHAKYVPISQHHIQYYDCLLQQGGG